MKKINEGLDGGSIFGTMASATVAYQFIKYLVTPFEKWDAYKLGLIDIDGKKIKDAITNDEKAQFTTWKNIIRKLKMLLAKVPGGSTKIAQIATALWLLKETYNDKKISDAVDILAEKLNIEIPNLILEDQSINIKNGKYILSNVAIHISEDLQPIDKFYGHYIYEFKTHNSTTYFTKDMLEVL